MFDILSSYYLANYLLLDFRRSISMNENGHYNYEFLVLIITKVILIEQMVSFVGNIFAMVMSGDSVSEVWQQYSKNVPRNYDHSASHFINMNAHKRFTLCPIKSIA